MDQKIHSHNILSISEINTTLTRYILNILCCNILQPLQNGNEIFNAIQPQMLCEWQGVTYNSAQMGTDLLRYIEANREELELLVEGNLYDRDMTFDEYLTMMKKKETCGYEITLRIIGEMFQVPILVVCSDFLWISEKVEPINCGIVLVQNCEGVFYGTQGKNKVNIGVVPKVMSPLSKKSKTSTPRKGGDGESGEHPFQADLSPVVEKEVSQENVHTSDSAPFIPNITPIAKDQKILTERQLNVGGENKTTTKRLGVSGPSQKITLPVQDISKSMGGSDLVTVKKMNDKHVIVRLKCTQCPQDFFTMGGYNSHLLMDHKIRNYQLHPHVTISDEDKCLTTSEPSVVSGDITPDDDVHMKTLTMLDELKSDKSLPDIPPARKPVKVTRPVPEEDRDPEKFYCEYCEQDFFTKDGVKQHTDNVHFGRLNLIFGHDDDYVAHKKNSPKPPEENTRGIKKRKAEKSVKERHDSVSRRKRVRMSAKPIQSDSSSDVTDR